jgi:hypothetical protein
MIRLCEALASRNTSLFQVRCSCCGNGTRTIWGTSTVCLNRSIYWYLEQGVHVSRLYFCTVHRMLQVRDSVFDDFFIFSRFRIRRFLHIPEVQYSTTSSYFRGSDFDDFFIFSRLRIRLHHILELPHSTSPYSRGLVFDDFFIFSRFRIRRLFHILEVSYSTTSSYSRASVFDDFFILPRFRNRRLLHIPELLYSTTSPYSLGSVFDDFFMFPRFRNRLLYIFVVPYATFSCSGGPVFDIRFKLELLMLLAITSKPIWYSVQKPEPLASKSFQVNHV